MEKLADNLLVGLMFVKLEILSTSFIDFLYDNLGELGQDLWVKWIKNYLAGRPTRNQAN